jgi:predicted transposase/invertase (TIGR01784 family)
MTRRRLGIMRKTATFADPKADVIFKRIFGSEAYKHLLVELLNALLELEEGQRILDVTYLPPEQSSPLPGMKFSVVDVKCRDERGKVYVVEMQVLNVEAFEKRVVLNAAKACTMQLEAGEAFSGMAPVVALTICNFRFWSVGLACGACDGGRLLGLPLPLRRQAHGDPAVS